MKATIINKEMNTEKYSRNLKAEYCRGYVVVSGNRCVLKVRIAQPGRNRVHCAILVYALRYCLCGGGHADGYGYHKPSAALENALNSVGITLDESISGRGNSAMIEALAAVAVAMGYDEPNVIEI